MLALFALAAAVTAHRSDRCDRYVEVPSPAQASAYAAAVQRATKRATSTSDVAAVMSAPGWRAVWAQPADSEPGVFIFRSAPGATDLRYVDVWGGVLGPDGADVMVSWLRKDTHMPLPLADCVARRDRN